MSFIASLFGAKALQATGDANDARLAELNQRDYAPGGRLYKKISKEQGLAAAEAAYQKTLGQQTTGATGDVAGQIDAAFKEGLDEGAGNITGFVSGAFSFVGRALGAILLGIPIWAWALAGLALWLYLGAPGKKKLFPSS
jgi:hypothetical protein